MLVEKEYPLSRGTLTLMLVAKLLVEQDNEMSKELLGRKFSRLKDQEDEVFGRILLENKMIDQVKHEANKEMEISKSVASIIEEIIKNSKGRQTIIETLEKVEDSDLSSKTKAFIINVCQDEMKTLELPIEIMKDISEHSYLKHIFCEHMKNM
ncbi:hypothetical protein Tco_0536330 [Tanacetum coccineum]